MMRRPFLLILLVATVTVAAGTYAAYADGGLPMASFTSGFDSTVQPAQLDAGDQLRYLRAWTQKDDDGTLVERRVDVVVTVLGAGEARDKRGVPRAVETVHVDVVEGGELLASFDCATLVGGVELVRRDVIAGVIGGYYTISVEDAVPILLSGSSSSARFDERAGFEGDCMSRSPLAGARLSTGDVLTLEEAMQGLSGTPVGVAETSLPATRAEFHGRPALRFLFPAEEGKESDGLSVTFADGLPGPVLVEATGILGVGFEAHWSSGKHGAVTVELVGIAESAESAALATYVGAKLPDAPAEDLEPYDPLRVDDTPFAFPYPFADAFAALVADPSMCFSRFLAEHPDAAVLYAVYDRSERDPFLRDAPTHGGWEIALQDGDALCGALTVKLATPVGGGIARNYPDPIPAWLGEPSPYEAPARPERVMTAAATARLLEREGILPKDAQWFEYNLAAWLNPTNGPSVEVGTIPVFGPPEAGKFTGALAILDPTDAALVTVMEGEGERVETMELGPLGEWSVPARGPLSLAALVGGPTLGQGLAVGVLAGVALLVFLAKAGLLPFYTRLRRDALLENPVRARLYEQVRREPGIHQADLVDFAGIGKSATARHLERLVKARFLAEVGVDGLTRYYAVGEVPPDVARRAALLRSDALRAVYELYRAQPDLTLREASRRLGVSAPSVHRSKKKLEDAGLLPVAHGADAASVAAVA
jgi:DNA-binding MarR family transcriptional regulator